MFTAIVHREEHQEWRSGYMESSTPSRLELVYSKNIVLFYMELVGVVKSFIKESVSDDACSPEIKFLFNGVPFTDLDSEEEDVKEPYLVLLRLEQQITQEMYRIERQIKQEIAEAANEARLQREREQRQRLEKDEREQLARLQAKYK